MKKRMIALGLRKLNYDNLYLFAQGIHDGVQKLPALFPAPVPALAVFQSSIDAMSAAVEKWGKRGSLGGQPEKMALLEVREILREHLKSYARYVMVTQADNVQSWLEVGFVLKRLPAKTNSLQPVQNFHQHIARTIPQGRLKIKWQRPLDVPAATVIAFKVYRSEDVDFTNAVLVGMEMNKGVFIDAPPKAGVLYYYWVIPVTTAGEGARSGMCRAFASPV